MMQDKYRDRRIERCESWITQAKIYETDDDMAFVCLWIAFNALYGYEDTYMLPQSGSQKSARPDGKFRSEFFNKICKHDQDGSIYDTIWETFPGPIRTLMKNRYTYKPYWESRNNEIDEEDYIDQKQGDDKSIHNALESKNTPKVLKKLFERLYVLRNQVMHGGATYASERNRDSIGDGHKILSTLMPVFLEIIKNNRGIELGRPYYFVGEDEE